jgi:hypothetical protein
MADEIAVDAVGLERLQRSVWVVVDPRDAVTRRRVEAPLLVSLTDVTAAPIASGSGVYCFTDLKLPAANYTARVTPISRDRERYFDGEQPFALAAVPVPGQPLNRNRVEVVLFPRPAYPFIAQATLVRGRLITASRSLPVANATAALTVDGAPAGVRGRTDERGEFVVFFPDTAPEDASSATLKTFMFTLQFTLGGNTTPPTVAKPITEGTTVSVGEISFPGL